MKVKDLRITTRTAGATIVALAIAGCAGNSASPEGATTVVSPSSVKAQIAIGTANLFGTATGMNVVATMRTPAGKSVLLNTPTITGPFALPAVAGTADGEGSTIITGPSTAEIATGGTISATPQVASGTPSSSIPVSTFGVSGGLFANGLFASNANNRGGSQGASAINDTPYAQPLYDQLNTAGSVGATTDPNGFVPWGGPPAFDPNKNGEGTRDGTFDASVLGVFEGLNVFEGVTPRTGLYNLRVVIPTNTTNTNITASTTLPAVTTLPTATAPTFVPDGLGGGSFAVTLPVGVTDALVQITDAGSLCHLGNPGVSYFTLHATASGTLTLPDLDGPRTATTPYTTTPTICTAAQNSAVTAGSPGDTFTVTLIGADYPLYASNYLFTLTSQTPTILGPAGSDDLTISPASTQTST